MSQSATDRRFNQQSETDERRFQLRMARQDRQDSLQAARNSLADRRYEDRISHRDKLEAEARADKISALEAENAALVPMDLNLTETTLEDDRSNIIGTDYDVNKLADAGQAPAVYTGYSQDANGVSTRDINPLNDEDNTVLDTYNKINANKDLTAEQKKLQIMQQLIPDSELAKDKSGAEVVGEKIKDVTSGVYNNPIINPVAGALSGMKALKDGYEYLTDSSTEKAEKAAKASVARKNKLVDKDAYQKLVDKVTKLSSRKETNRLGKDKIKKSEAAFSEWMKQYQKPKYAQKSVTSPVKIDKALLEVKKFISREEKKINPNLTGLARARKINAIRKRAASGLDPYMKSRLKRIERQEKTSEFITHEQIKTAAGIKRDRAKTRSKEASRAREYIAKKPERDLKAKETEASIKNKNADTKYKERKK